MPTINRDSHGLYFKAFGKIWRPQHAADSPVTGHVPDGRDAKEGDVIKAYPNHCRDKHQVSAHAHSWTHVDYGWFSHGEWKGKKSDEVWNPRTAPITEDDLARETQKYVTKAPSKAALAEFEKEFEAAMTNPDPLAGMAALMKAVQKAREASTPTLEEAKAFNRGLGTRLSKIQENDK